MGKRKNGITRWERYLSSEIGIEFKACLYFYSILFFYSMYKVLSGYFETSIIHMAEMIFAAYVMGYIQVYLLSNFDEAEVYGVKEILYSVMCSGIYTGVAYLGKWYDENHIVYGIFFAFMVLAYSCAAWIYRIKRRIDTKMLNEDLKAFQERKETNYE